MNSYTAPFCVYIYCVVFKKLYDKTEKSIVGAYIHAFVVLARCALTNKKIYNHIDSLLLLDFGLINLTRTQVHIRLCNSFFQE